MFAKKKSVTHESEQSLPLVGEELQKLDSGWSTVEFLKSFSLLISRILKRYQIKEAFFF